MKCWHIMFFGWSNMIENYLGRKQWLCSNLFIKAALSLSIIFLDFRIFLACFMHLSEKRKIWKVSSRFYPQITCQAKIRCHSFRPKITFSQNSYLTLQGDLSLSIIFKISDSFLVFLDILVKCTKHKKVPPCVYLQFKSPYLGPKSAHSQKFG